jgi:peptidoglycan/xylan/chitin deacetylase (PgdA/CDA1 family)
VDLAQAAIYNVTGVRPHLFRPPYGRKTPWELEYVKRKGLVTVTWSVSANDPHKPPSDAITEKVLHAARPGAIILLHDGNGIKHGADRSRTVAALPQIIESLKAQGYTFVTVPEVLGISPYIE